MRFSIIVPLYNSESYIRECIESIINQKFSDFELILVDDGSTDNSSEICDEYSNNDNRIKVVHKNNEGATSARKTGLSLSNGEYIINIDSDDFVSKNLLLRLNEIIENNNPEIILFNFKRVSKGKLYFDKNQVIDKIGLYENDAIKALKYECIHKLDNEYYSFGISPGIALKAFKRDFLVKFQTPVPDSIKLGEDFAITLPAFLASKKIYITDEVLYYYRDNETSIVHIFNENATEDLKLLISYLKPYVNMKDYNLNHQMSEYIVHRIFGILFQYTVNFKSYDEYKNKLDEIDELNVYTKLSRYSKHCVKWNIINFVIKHRLYGLIWIFYRNKYKKGL